MTIFPDENNKDSTPKNKVEIWLLSMSDMIALMLTFFVLLYAISTLRNEVRIALKPLNETPVVIRLNNQEAIQRNVEHLLLDTRISLPYLARILEETLSKDPFLSDAVVTVGQDWLVLSLPSHLLFQEGSSRLSQDSQASIEGLAAVLAVLPSRISVVGHTNSKPIRTALYPSNWHLSLARAAEVSNAIRRAGYKRIIRTAGHADGAENLIDSRLPLELRETLALRVDVILHREDAPS